MSFLRARLGLPEKEAAGAVGAYIGGPIADFFTVHVPEVPGLGYVVIFAIYGGLFLLSSVALMWVRGSRRQQVAS